MRKLWNYEDMREADLDLYRYNLRSATTGNLHRKPTKVLCNSGVIAQGLAKQCRGGHEHAPTAGADTRPAGNYTREFCREVVKLYVEARERNVWDVFTASDLKEDGSTEDLGPA